MIKIQAIYFGVNLAFEIQIPIDEELILTEFQTADVAALVELMNDPVIYATTLRIPSPYTEDDARKWIDLANQIQDGFFVRTNWSIRDSEKRLLGGISFIFREDVRHRAEIGYWVGSEFWGRGIASRAVATVCKLGFTQFGFSKITALVFDGNSASDRVLLKNHFQQEGFLRNQILKNGQLIDAKEFGLLAEWMPTT